MKLPRTNHLSNQSRRIKVNKSAKKANKNALVRDLHGLGATHPAVRSHNPPTATQIRALRQLLCLSQASFATQIGAFNWAVVSRWENGGRSPSKHMTARLRELAAMNRIDMDQLADPEYYQSNLEVKIFTKRKQIA